MVYRSLIKKEKVEAIIRTTAERIEGVVFKLPQNRMLDMLNDKEQCFIPVSQAKVFNLDTGNLMFEADFLAVNKEHVVIIAENSVAPED